MTVGVDQPPVERAVVIINEHSSRARQVARELGAISLPQILIEASRDSEEMRNKINDYNQPHNVLIVAAGDGTLHHTVNWMLDDTGRQMGLNALPVLPLRGGNANDTATMLNGRTKARRILERGRAVQLQPLEVTVTNQQTASTRFALGYFSVGGTAAASAKLEEVKRTSSWLTRLPGVQVGREGQACLQVIAAQPSFGLTVNGSERTTATDFLALRGNRIAKIGRPHADLSLPAFEIAAMQAHGLPHTLREMIKMQQGKLAGTMTSNCEVLFEACTDRQMQFDGETAPLEDESLVSLTISPHSYTALTTRF